jgi:LCP family protein required for cell wall assembly
MVTATDGKRAATMSEWPEGWFRGDEGKTDGTAEPGAADQTVSIPAGAADATNPAGQYQVRDYARTNSPGGGAAPPGSWPAQPPTQSAPGSAPPRRRIRGGRGWRSWSRPRQVGTVVAGIVVLLIVALVSTYFYLNSHLNRQNVLLSYSARPVAGAGTNWLITGSDSRQGLTRKQELQLSVGSAAAIAGERSDTILILHIPASGKPLLISIPRDSYVNIPGHGYNKINAAFAFGGPALLAETVQNATGLYISHYMGIGFGGFVNVVNSVGGVRMCLTASLRDVSSGVNLKAGCQTLNGTQALAYVRDRHNFATQDLQREQDQRLFLHALLTKMTSPGVMFNPFAIFPAASGAVDTLTVDDGTSLYDLYGVAEAMRDPLTTTVPIANANYSTAAGDAVQWNAAQARELFSDLNSGKPVPKSLITGSKQGAVTP